MTVEMLAVSKFETLKSLDICKDSKRTILSFFFHNKNPFVRITLKESRYFQFRIF